MTDIFWPSDLPQQFLLDSNWQDSSPDNPTVRSQVDAGIPKTRNRFTTKTRMTTGSLLMSLAQYKGSFLNFYNFTTLNGALFFYMPELGDNTTLRQVRIISWQTSVAEQQILVVCQLEIMPQLPYRITDAGAVRIDDSGNVITTD